MRIKSRQKQNYSTQYSQVVPHPTTNCANTSLTSEIRRDPVYSSVYGRSQNLKKWRLTWTLNLSLLLCLLIQSVGIYRVEALVDKISASEAFRALINLPTKFMRLDLHFSFSNKLLWSWLYSSRNVATASCRQHFIRWWIYWSTCKETD